MNYVSMICVVSLFVTHTVVLDSLVFCVPAFAISRGTTSSVSLSPAWTGTHWPVTSLGGCGPSYKPTLQR